MKRSVRLICLLVGMLCFVTCICFAKAEDIPSLSIRELAAQAKEFYFQEITGHESNPEQRMAHNIYSEPDLSKTSGRFSGFSIDFCTEDFAKGTYWALCNWEMDISDLQQKYTVEDAGGAYAGLQNTIDGPIAIMSFWEIHYIDDKGKNAVLISNRIYPNGAEHRFGGEGEGTNYLGKYNWKSGHWYRMMLRCYDQENGDTIVEQWLMDLEQDEWTLFSAFNTNLKNSCFVGDMSQFMENYDYNYCNDFRSFRYKNIWVKDYLSNQWIPITKSTLSTDTWWNNKKGNYAFGKDDSCLWGITCGYGDDVINTGEHGPMSKQFSIEAGIIPSEPWTE